MKTINQISPELRDELLMNNIGKYNKIESRLIHPIGQSIDIYNSIPFKKDSIGLLEFTNSNKEITSNSELSEVLYIPSSFIRGDVPIDLGYNKIKPQKYSYVEGYEYNDPKDNKWVSMGVNAAISYAMGDSVGVSLNKDNGGVISTSLDTYTSLVGRVAKIASGDTDLSKIGAKSLLVQLSNSAMHRSRMMSEVNEFFKKPIDFYNSVDVLDFEKLNNSGSFGGTFNVLGKIFPIYFYSEIRRGDKTKKYSLDSDGLSVVTDYSWVNEIGYKKKVVNGGDGDDDEYDGYSESNNVLIDENGVEITIDEVTSSKQSLLSKTHKLFQDGKIETMISHIGRITSNGDSSVSKENRQSKGRNLHRKNNYDDLFRVWTVNNQYNNKSALIRPFNSTDTEILNKTLLSVRPGADSLEKYGVLQDDGFVKVSPYKNDDFSLGNNQREVKKYMFSIENLAWKGSIDSLIEGTSQEGPNGGRIMWFPPYDISFNETTSVNINADTFIGRGEPVYTYINTERGGTLNFKVIVDHPSILNYYNRDGYDKFGKKIEESDYLRFFAGKDVLLLPKNEPIKDEIVPPKSIPPTNANRSVSFTVYFPNNYSGKDDGYEDALEYLMYGSMCSSTGGNGYENNPGDNIIYGGKNDWKGLTPFGASTGCAHGGLYYYRSDSKQNLSSHQYKDTRSFGLNYLKSMPSDPDNYSFRDAYSFIYNNKNTESEDFKDRKARRDYVYKYIATNIDEMDVDYLKNNKAIADMTGIDIAQANQELNEKLAIYNNSTIELKSLKEIDIERNPGGFISISTMKTDVKGNMVYAEDAVRNRVQSYWNSYNEQLKVSKSNLKEYLIAEYNLKTTGIGHDPVLALIRDAALNKYEISNSKLSDIATQLKISVDLLLDSSNSDTYNDFYQTLLDAKQILIIGSSSKHGKEKQNEALTKHRSELIKNWLYEHNKKAEFKIESAYADAIELQDKDISSRDAKKDRFVRVIITTSNETLNIEGEANKIGYTTGKKTEQTNVESKTIQSTRSKKSMYGYHHSDDNSPELKLRNDEAMFFQKMGDTGIGEIIKGKLSEKIKYFHPAFHSTTPEGFNSRLTFLHQCTRQGPTTSTSDYNKRSATNMAFGRPPICVLRIGDFYNTKVVFDSLNIDFDPLVWDLNQEGIGVQPMIATVSMNFKFIGGSDLTGPIARLQNAVTFNFFANTGVYDDRNDRITSHLATGDTYHPMYNPGVYDNRVISNKSSENGRDMDENNVIKEKGVDGYDLLNEELKTIRHELIAERRLMDDENSEKEVVNWKTKLYSYQIEKNKEKRRINAMNSDNHIIYSSSWTTSATNRALFEQAKTFLNDPGK